MKHLTLLFILATLSFSCAAQLKANDAVFLKFKDIDGEVNVNGDDALGMMKDYLVNRTTLNIVQSESEAAYTLQLSVIEKNMGNRKGQLIVLDNSNSKAIMETKWVKGTMNAFYGYSGSRHAIGILVKKYLLKEFEDIVKEEE